MEEHKNVQRLGASRNLTWIVYQTTNIVNNKIYIGVHKTENPKIFDGYIGNGCYISQPSTYMYAKTAFLYALNKYGITNFVRTTLKEFDNEESAYKLEAEIVNEDFLKRNDVYNMILGGKNPPVIYRYKAISKYNLEGLYICTYNSVEDAAKDVERASSTISDACINKYQCGNFYWSFERTDSINVSDYHDTRITKILYQYSKEGVFLKLLNLTRESGYSQASQSAILGNLVDNKFYFCYVKSDNYSKARDIYLKNLEIYQYDSSGNYVKPWKYLEAVSLFKGLKQALRHKTSTIDGSFWAYQCYDEFNKPVHKASKLIAKYDLDGNLIKVYKNSSDCYKENGKGTYKVFAGIRKSYKGFVYKYV